VGKEPLLMLANGIQPSPCRHDLSSQSLDLLHGPPNQMLVDTHVSFTRCDLTRAFRSRGPQFVTPLGSVVLGDETQRGPDL